MSPTTTRVSTTTEEARKKTSNKYIGTRLELSPLARYIINHPGSLLSSVPQSLRVSFIIPTDDALKENNNSYCMLHLLTNYTRHQDIRELIVLIAAVHFLLHCWEWIRTGRDLITEILFMQIGWMRG